MLSYDEDDDEDDYDGGYSDSDEYGFGFGFGGGRYGGSDSESDYGSDDSDAILRRLVSSKEGPAYTKYDEPKYRKEILAVLKTVGEARTGLEFAHGGTVPEDTRIPLITVNGVGRIAFPLLDAQVDALRKVAVVAPYGAGIGKTVVDTKVRDTWKIEASKVKISGKDWDKHLSAMVDQSCAALGLSASDLKVEARLHDLLLYDKGGHFKKHRDTEKEPGMFGTLIVQLPAEHTGGTLVVEHAGQSRIFEFSKDSAEESPSFWPPSGAFNLVRTTDGPAPTLENNAAKEQQSKLETATQSWIKDAEAPLRFFLPLTHKYTQQDFGRPALKGQDKATVDFLASALDSRGHYLMDVHILLVETTRSGEAERGRRKLVQLEDQDDEEVGSAVVLPQAESSTVWSTPLSNFYPQFDGKEIIGINNELDLYSGKPFDEDYEGYAGNEGPTISQSYRNAFVVFWPREISFATFTQHFDAELAAQVLQARGMGQFLAEQLQAVKVTIFRLQRLMNQLNQNGQPQLTSALAKVAAEAFSKSETCAKLKGEMLAAVVAMFSGLGEAGENAFDLFVQAAKPHINMESATDLLNSINNSNTSGGLSEDARKHVAVMLQSVVVIPSDMILQDQEPFYLSSGSSPLLNFHNAIAKFVPKPVAKPEIDLLSILLESIENNLEHAFKILKHVQNSITPDRKADPRYRRLALRYCALVAKNVPKPCYSQPSAFFPQDARIEAFLQGPDQKLVIREEFEDSKDARRFVKDIFRSGYSSAKYGYNVDVEVAGKGENARVIITKDPSTFTKSKERCAAMFALAKKFYQRFRPPQATQQQPLPSATLAPAPAPVSSASGATGIPLSTLPSTTLTFHSGFNAARTGTDKDVVMED